MFGWRGWGKRVFAISWALWGAMFQRRSMGHAVGSAFGG
jgi:hypothetical protein